MVNPEFFIQQKRLLAKKYFDFFKDKSIRFFEEPKKCKSNYWLNLVILRDKVHRDEFFQYTNDNKVMTRPLWQLMNCLAMFK